MTYFCCWRYALTWITINNYGICSCILECQHREDWNVISCNGMKFWSATWYHIHCPCSSIISMFIDFSYSICCDVLNVVNFFCVFQNLNLLNVVWMLCVMWLKFCVKCKCHVLKLEHLCLLCIFECLCLLYIPKPF